MNKGDLITEAAKVMGQKKVAEKAINRILKVAKNKSKVWGMKVALAAILAALNFSALAFAAPAPKAGEWERTIAAAKKEGKVTVIADVTAALRDALTLEFQKKFGISVEVFGVTGRELAPRVIAERKAGMFSWDIYIHGPSTALEALLPVGAFDPLEPTLILPDVKNPKTWRGGAIEFLDPGKTVMVMTPFQRGTIFYNTNLVNPKEFKSYKDLLDPKWKGKIIVDDPRKAGPGGSTFVFFYLHPDLGTDFIRALGKQQLTLFRDYAQEADAVGQGRYPLLIGTADFVVNSKAKQGVPIATVDSSQLKEGSDVSSANGNLALFNRAPHPNAAKIYINWLLSKEGQTIFARVNGYVSARLDVPTDHVEPWRVPLPGAKNIKTYTKEAKEVKEDIMPLLKEIFGK